MPSETRQKGPSGDAYDLPPMAFAKHCGFVIPKNDGRNVGSTTRCSQSASASTTTSTRTSPDHTTLQHDGGSMTDTTSGALQLGEARRAPDETCRASRHDDSRAAYQAGCRCTGAIAANRAYYREYNRAGREIAVWRSQQNEYARRYQHRVRSDPQTHEALNANRRRRAAARRARARYDARHAIDAVVVQRLVNGVAVRHNRAERLEAVRQLRDLRIPYLDIATRLNVNARQVHRDLADLGLINTVTGAA